MKKKNKRNRLGIFTCIVLGCSVFWLSPLLLIFINSFKSHTDLILNFLALPKSWSLDKYIETWMMFEFPKLVGNTLLYTVASTILVALFAPMAAYKLARTKSKLSYLCFGLVILPMMVPFQSYMISLTRLTANVGLSGKRIGYILVTAGLLMPLAVYMIHGFVKNVPIELEECARIDGASDMRIYFNIVLPLLKPILTTVVVLDSLSTWNDIITNQLIVGGKQDAMNISSALYMRFSASTSDWEHALPGIIMSIIPALIFFIFMQKYIMGGVTEGAVKG